MANSEDPSQLIWIYTVCKGRAYQGSAGQGLNSSFNTVKTHTWYHFHFISDMFRLCHTSHNIQKSETGVLQDIISKQIGFTDPYKLTGKSDITVS